MSDSGTPPESADGGPSWAPRIPGFPSISTGLPRIPTAAKWASAAGQPLPKLTDDSVARAVRQAMAGFRSLAETTGYTTAFRQSELAHQNIVKAFEGTKAFSSVLAEQTRVAAPWSEAAKAAQKALEGFHPPRFTFPDFGYAKLREDMLKRSRQLFDYIDSRGFQPTNWDGVDHEAVQGVLLSDGIPLANVPRASIVAEIVSSETIDQRRAVLEARRLEVADDCEEALDQVSTAELAGFAKLAQQGLVALRAGHFAAAGTLFVVTTESVVSLVFNSRKYPDIRRRANRDLASTPLHAYRFVAALLPIVPFYEPWFPESGEPVPSKLSRHVVVHQPTAGHLEAGYAVQAGLMLVSLLASFDEVLQSRALRRARDADVESS